MNSSRQLAFNRTGAAAAEFALVVPLLILFLLGIIDVGRLMYTWNKAEKAVHMGVRFAVVTNFVPENLDDDSGDFTTRYNLVGGDPVPTSIFNTTTCDNSTCTGGWGYDSSAFSSIVNRMHLMYPEIGPSNVLVRYDNVGMGFAGDPSGPDVAALITVSVRNVTFQPMILLGGSITLPPFSAALTVEDGAGTVSN